MGQLWTILISVTAAFILVWVILLIALIVSRPAPPRRCASAARRDLLDANEWTWAFVGVDRVDLTENRHVKEFVTLASEDRCRSYCGRKDYLARTRRRQSGRWLIEASPAFDLGHPPPHPYKPGRPKERFGKFVGKVMDLASAMPLKPPSG